MRAFEGFGITDVDQLVVNHDFYAYHVSGKFRAPRLLDIKKHGTLDERAWPSDVLDPSLRNQIGSHEVQFWCAIPKPQYKADPNKPAPVVLYAHGYTSNKLEQLGLALHAKFGIAGCSIDAVLHGVDLPADSDRHRPGPPELYGLGAAYDALSRTAWKTWTATARSTSAASSSPATCSARATTCGRRCWTGWGWCGSSARSAPST